MTTRSCAACGSKLAPGARECVRCAGVAAAAVDANAMQYGMVDLGADADLGTAATLDTWSEAPARRKTGDRRPNARKSAQQASPAQAAPNPRRTGSGPRSPNPARASGVTTKTTNPDPAAQTYGRGMMMDDDPFNQAFGDQGAGATLELGAEKAPARERKEARAASEPPPSAETQETPEQQRARRIAEIAAYGAKPGRLIAAPLYCARVLLRKRALTVELAALSAQRKRAEDLAFDERKALGEALYALREDSRLRPLAKLLAAVDSAEHQLGDVRARAERRQQQVATEVARLDQRIERGERATQPLRAREVELAQAVDELMARAKRADNLRRRAEGELEAANKAKAGVDVERIRALTAERDAHHGEFQTVGIEMQPLGDELNVLRAELDTRQSALDVLSEKRRAALAVAQRAEQNQRFSSGSAQGARTEALSALATTAQRLGLAELARGRAQAVADAAARAEQKRKQEELHRAALQSYDKTMYGHGLTALMSGSVLFLVCVAALIFF